MPGHVWPLAMPDVGSSQAPRTALAVPRVGLSLVGQSHLGMIRALLVPASRSCCHPQASNHVGKMLEFFQLAPGVLGLVCGRAYSVMRTMTPRGHGSLLKTVLLIT